MSLISGNVLVGLLFFTVLSLLREVRGQCSLNPNLIRDDKKNGDRRQNLLNKLNSLTKEFRNHPIEVHVKDRTYTIKICPEDNEIRDHSAFDESESRFTRSLGRMNESDVMMTAFGDTLYLIYRFYTNGDEYRNACNKTERRTITSIRITAAVIEPTLFLTEESVGNGEDFCYYVFELYYPVNSEIGSILNKDSCQLLPSTTPVSPTSVRTEVPVPSTNSSVVTHSSSTATINVAVAAAQKGSASATYAAGSIMLVLFVSACAFVRCN